MSVRIEFPGGLKLMSMNDRVHWRQRAAQTKAWRENVYYEACRQVPVPRLQPPSLIQLSLPVPDKRRRDPHNYAPTLKAVIDGLVDAGLWPDDTPEYVRTLEPLLVPFSRARDGQGPVVIELFPR